MFTFIIIWHDVRYIYSMEAATQNLVSAYVLAKKLGVSHTIIYKRIDAGEIDTIIIGKTKYIDANKYNDLSFNDKKTGARD